MQSITSPTPPATTSQHTEHAPLMKFGKFRGSKICDLPDDYLLWLACLDLRPPLVGYVLKEMARRMGEMVPDAPMHEDKAMTR